MSQDRLKIISVENSSEQVNSPSAKKEEAQARFERLWLLNPEQFNPLRDCMNRERISRSWKLLTESFDPQEKKAVDLGCGAGILSFKLRDAGAEVDAVDIASNALKHIQKQHIHVIQDWMPKTRLKDDDYDLVVCTELIAEIQPNDFRLFFSELARIIKKEGILLCSTPLDLNSEGALERLASLAETEFVITAWTFSYHRLYIRLCDFFEAPARFFQASRDKIYRQKQLSKRRGPSRFWFKLNSMRLPAPFWKLVSFIATPLVNFLKQATTLMLSLEKICRFFWDEKGISHVIFVGHRKPIVIPQPSPILGKEKIRKWE